MKYYDFVKELCGGEIDTDISDKTMDMVVNFEYEIDTKSKDDFDWVMDYLAKNLEVVQINFYARIIILDIYKFCEDNFNWLQPLFDNYFYGYTLDDIKENGKDEIIANMVFNMEQVISGDVSEKLYKEFKEVVRWQIK